MGDEENKTDGANISGKPHIMRGAIEDILLSDLKWNDFSSYLKKEHGEGKREFRLVVYGCKNKTFYIHPYGKDGESFDGEL